LYKLLALSLAGAIGTLCRYGLSGLVQKSVSAPFPWGTFSVNAIGCFIFGFVWTLSAERMYISSDIRVFILTGFLGAFTTFSAFIFETDQLMESGQFLLVGINILGGIAAGLVAYVIGAFLGRLL
jgi:CrcB protein